MKILGKIFKIIGLVLFSILVILTCLFFIYNEQIPEGENSKAADELAMKMLKAVNHEAYEKTQTIEWTFAGIHHYKWYKKKNLAEIKWITF